MSRAQTLRYGLMLVIPLAASVIDFEFGCGMVIISLTMLFVEATIFATRFMVDCTVAMDYFGRAPVWRNPIKARRLYLASSIFDSDFWREKAFELYVDDELIAKGMRSKNHKGLGFDREEVFGGSRSQMVWEYMLANRPDLTQYVIGKIHSIEGRPWLLGFRPDLLPTANADAEFYQSAVSFLPKNLKHVPEEFQTFDMCEEAWGKDHSVAQYVKNKEFQAVLLFA
jgi:hypothetical protein